MMTTVMRRGTPPMPKAMRMSSTRRPNMTMRRRVNMTRKTSPMRTACQMLNSAKERSDHTVNSIN
jgi:hypothetical protein